MEMNYLKSRKTFMDNWVIKLDIFHHSWNEGRKEEREGGTQGGRGESGQARSTTAHEQMS